MVAHRERLARIGFVKGRQDWHYLSVPDRLKAAPYQVKGVAVRDACLTVSALKRRNRGIRRGEADFAEASYRIGKHDQNCFIPASAVKPLGAQPR